MSARDPFRRCCLSITGCFTSRKCSNSVCDGCSKGRVKTERICDVCVYAINKPKFAEITVDMFEIQNKKTEKIKRHIISLKELIQKVQEESSEQIIKHEEAVKAKEQRLKDLEAQNPVLQEELSKLLAENLEQSEKLTKSAKKVHEFKNRLRELNYEKDFLRAGISMQESMLPKDTKRLESLEELTNFVAEIVEKAETISRKELVKSLRKARDDFENLKR